MNIYDIRRKNAHTLAAGKTLAEVADLLGKSPTQLSRFMGKNYTKNIGDQIAREFEAAFGKPEGWMDKEHPEEYPYIVTERSPGRPKKSISASIAAHNKNLKIIKAANIRLGYAGMDWREIPMPELNIRAASTEITRTLTTKAMEGGEPHIPQGAILTIDRALTPPIPGDLIYIESKNPAAPAAIGVYHHLAGRHLLVPGNQRFPTVDVDIGNVTGIVTQWVTHHDNPARLLMLSKKRQESEKTDKNTTTETADTPPNWPLV